MSDGQIEEFQEWATENDANGLPQVVLPGSGVTISQCAEKLFSLIAPTKKLFMRGGAVVTLVPRDNGLLALEILRPAAARSFIEKFGRLFAWRSGAGIGLVLKPVTCPQEMADALLQSDEAKKILPRVEGLMNCPVLREVAWQLGVAGRGYDEKTRLLVTGGEIPPVVPLAEAVSALLGLLDQFNFQSDGDKARAVASMISPALQRGGFIKQRVPADVAEADKSQSGKGYRQKITAAVYGERLSVVTHREGGVGSVDESFNEALVAGRPFIQLDNFRGRFASAHVEAFMTTDGEFACRVPYAGSVGVSPEKFMVCLTSNGVDTTPDFANRSDIIRIYKQPLGFEFKKYPEGALLEQVRAQQAYYLGCVFAVIRDWHRQGKPRTNETRHDFREWVQVVDWIGQNIFKTAPVMDGHQQAQERVSNPALVWLRKWVLKASEAGELNRALTATDIHGLCDDAGIEVPGLRPGSDEDKGKKIIGCIMAKLFHDNDTLEVECYRILREERYITRENTSVGGGFKSKTYTVSSTDPLQVSAATQQPQQGVIDSGKPGCFS